MLYVIIFRNFRRKPYKKDCKQLSICNPFYSKLLSKRIFLFCYHYVYRTFADSKFLCGLTHSSFVFNNIACNFHCPFFDIIFQRISLRRRCFYSVCPGFTGYSPNSIVLFSLFRINTRFSIFLFRLCI